MRNDDELLYNLQSKYTSVHLKKCHPLQKKYNTPRIKKKLIVFFLFE